MRRTLLLASLALVAMIVMPTTPPAGAADPAAEVEVLTLVNGERAARGIPALGSHPVLVAKAQGWAAVMAAQGGLSHSNLPDGVTVQWSRLAENVGRGGTVGAVHAAMMGSPAHYQNIVDGGFQWVGVGVAYGGGSVYVAEVFMAGAAPVIDWSFISRDSRGRAGAVNPRGGFYVMNGNGTVGAYDGAPYFGSAALGWDIARDLAVMPDGQGYLVLDGFGGVHKFGSARSGQVGAGVTTYFGWDVAQSLAVMPDGQGYGVLDAWGGLHTTGSALRVPLPYWAGWDVARSLAYSNHGLYVLDAWGGVHTGGSAVRRASPYWPGWDVARDIAVAPDDRGYALLDGRGGVHPAGSAPTAVLPEYSAFDRWRALVWAGTKYLAVRNDGFAIGTSPG